jgi:hypothetical protein
VAIEIEVAPYFSPSEVAGVLLGAVVVRFDGPIETMHITALFSDCNDQAANEAEAKAKGKQLPAG